MSYYNERWKGLNDMGKMVLLNPAAKTNRKGTASAAERIHAFSGKTIGFLDNSKPNAGQLLHFLGHYMGKRYENLQFIHGAKILPARPLDDHLLEKLARCNLVINGVGD